jgi:hypothetical protein
MAIAAPLARSQDGQQASRPGWPCVPGRAVDPAYLEASEATGGQVYIFQRSEIAQSAQIMIAANQHPATILRAVGHLNGSRDFEFPVDSTVSSLLVMAFLQCRNSVALALPTGAEFNPAAASMNIDLQAGRALRIEHPDAGPWRVHLKGTGLFLLSVLAQSEIVFTDASFSAHRSPAFGVSQSLDARISGAVSNLNLQLVDAGAAPLSDLQPLDATPDGPYRATITPRSQHLRVLVTGTDASAWPFQRMYPVLFHAAQPK